MSTIALMLRSRVLREPALQEKKGNDFGTFTLECTADQWKAAIDLYKLFIAHEGEPDTPSLQTTLHALCVSLFRPASSYESPVAYPTDQMLFIRSLQPDGKWKPAWVTYESISRLHTVFLLIFTQMARLHQARSDKYTPWDMMEHFMPEPKLQVSLIRYFLTKSICIVSETDMTLSRRFCKGWRWKIILSHRRRERKWMQRVALWYWMPMKTKI